MATDKGFFNYWVVENSGKGFITHTDSRKFWIGGYPGNVWVCDDIPESRDWGARNSAATKTKSQAQTIVTNPKLSTIGMGNKSNTRICRYTIIKKTFVCCHINLLRNRYVYGSIAR